MKPPTVRVVYLTDSPEAGRAGAAPAAPVSASADIRPLPVPAQVPLPLLAAIGERLAASTSRLQETAQGQGAAQGASADSLAELARLERFGLQLQELALVVARAQQLRQESVDLGLALLQTVAEWSAEADRLGVELHGPACSEPVHANPAALKHLLDLVVEHTLQQGRTVRLEVEAPPAARTVRVVATVSSEPASQCPQRDTLAWATLQWFARALGIAVERAEVPRGERLDLQLPRS